MDPVTHVGWLKYLYWFSDLNIFTILDLIKKDFSILAILFGGAFAMIFKRWTDWTPWTTDDKISDLISERLGLKKKDE